MDEADAGDAGTVAGRRRRLRARAAGLLLIASLVAAGAVVAWNDLRLRREAARQYLATVAAGSSREIALTLAHFQRAFAGVGTDFSAVEHEAPAFAAPLRAQAIAGVLRRHAALSDLTLLEVPPPGASATGRRGMLVVGAPQRMAGGTIALPLLMQLPDGPDGRQRWLLGRLRADALREALAGRDLGRGGVGRIVHADGTAIAGIGDWTAMAGATGPTAAGNRGQLRLSDARRLLDADRHVFHQQDVTGYPLRVLVGSEHSHMLAGWHMFVAVVTAGCIVLLGVWLFGLRMLGRGERREVDMRRSIERSEHAIDDLRVRVRDAETQYRFLYERFPLAACVYDHATLRILEVNDAAVAQYGYTREELLDMRSPQLLAEGGEDDVRTAIRHDPQMRGASHWKHRRRDGSVLDVSVYAADVVFQNRPARLALALDITDRVLLEAERARSDARFQMVTRATSDAVWDWDIETGALWWNEGFRVHYGWDWRAKAASIDAWTELVHPDDRLATRASLDAAVATDAADWRANYRMLREDGSYADVEDRGLILRDDQGRALRAVGGVLDVTRQRRDEADLRLLRRAMEATENGIVIVNAELDDQPLVYVNPAFERITGYPAEEAVGRSHRMLLGDADSAAHAEMAEAMGGARDVRMQVQNRRKDGSLFWSELRMTPVRDRQGRLTHFVAILSDVSERKRAEDALAYRATHDALTGLPNRELLQERLAAAIRAGAGRVIGVAFMDLDDFKLINDSLGHAVGDEVLATISRRLADVVSERDIVARFGGDEFVLMLDCDDHRQLAMRVDDVLAAMARPVEVHGAALQVTPSVGYCRFPDDGDEALGLLRRADQAMYQAKRQGRNCVVAYRDEFDLGASQRLDLVLQLREALQHDQFVLAFQPQFDRDNRPVGMEALLRWRHPVRGLLAPAHFIAACEDSGLIVPIGRWVLREAARHHHLLAERGWDKLRIAVNVSAAQFQQGLAEDVAMVMRDHALPRDVLELELTESVVMANPDAAIRSMAEIAQLGVQIAIDDFGTGYSSLAYLKRLPLHRLKLDRSFVRDLGRDPDDEAICAAIIRLAQSLELSTTAEGVETETQWRWLRDRGCDEMQGFLLAKPAPFEEILARLGTPQRMP